MTATGARRSSLSQRARPPAVKAPEAESSYVAPGRRGVGPSEDSKSVRSPWVWRAFGFMALVALGLCVTFLFDGHPGFAAAWAVITIGWGATAGALFRAHLRIT